MINTLSIFNSLHTRLQFTMEIDVNEYIFLIQQLSLIIRIIFYTYHKATFFGRFLNLHLNHFLYHKRDTIISFLDKIFCYPRFQQKNLIDAIHIFLENSYPLSFIFFAIKKRLKFHTLKILHIIYKLKKNI